MTMTTIDVPALRSKFAEYDEGESVMFRIETVRSLLDAYEERNRLRAALQPFADAAENLDDDFRDVSDIWEHSSAMSITGGDLRAARAALKGTKP